MLKIRTTRLEINAQYQMAYRKYRIYIEKYRQILNFVSKLVVLLDSVVYLSERPITVKGDMIF